MKSIEEIGEIVALYTTIIVAATKLGLVISQIIKSAEGLNVDDKDALIAKIKEAQAKVPVWE